MRAPNAPDSIWRWVHKTPGCWLWSGCLTHNGYGVFGIGGKNFAVHRLAYELLVGPIPVGMVLDHTCLVRTCCRPLHLEVVTRAENSRRVHRPDRMALRALLDDRVPVPREVWSRGVYLGTTDLSMVA